MGLVPFQSWLIKVILSVAIAVTSSPVDSTGTPLVEEYEGVYLEVIKSKNILNVYLNNHIIYQFKVATGKRTSATPNGVYQIITKVKNPWYIPKNIAGGSPHNPLGTRWLGLNVGQTNGYKYGIHGTNNPTSIGHSVSAGCIRMHNKDVEWLYDHIPLYTYIIIKEDEDDQPLHPQPSA